MASDIGSYDIHTHSHYSDGGDSVAMMVRGAEAAQLDVFAITDHLWRTDAHLGQGNHSVAELIVAIDVVRDQTPVSLLVGVEGTILDTRGTVSVGPAVADMLDLVLVDFSAETAGIYKDSPGRTSDVVLNTIKAITGAAQQTQVDIIAHPLNVGRCSTPVDLRDFRVQDLEEVAAVLAGTNTYFELMNQMHYWFPQMAVADVTAAYVDVLQCMAESGVRFSAGSDAHRVGSVGNLTWVCEILARAQIAEKNLIDPLQDLPLRHFESSGYA